MRFLSIISLSLIYLATYVVSSVGKLFGKSKKLNDRVVINGTFHNPNWFNAHIVPIVNSQTQKVVLVTDEPVFELDNLIYECPPQKYSKIFTRAGAKFIWTIFAAFKYRPKVIIGYHIFPSAITALIASSLIRSKSCYQVTAGQLELEGGGFGAENKLLVGLNRHSSIVQYFAHLVVRQFDLLIVRGSEARKYISNAGYHGKIEIVTGSVLTDDAYIQPERAIDVIFVARLAEYKRPDIFIEVISEAVKEVPDLRVSMVGDGPMKEEIEEMINKYGLSANIQMLGKRSDVLKLLGNSKILTLVSRWEGVSIAMLEGMALGAVPVVFDVGDLKDYVKSGETGFIHPFGDKKAVANSIIRLIKDGEVRLSIESNAKELVHSRCDRDVLTRRWRDILNEL
jgi:glycosyltransferase involved in cell wall biosynthesis